MSMADEMQRVIDTSNRTDDVTKCDRLLRILPLCGALARHPHNLELVVAGGNGSLASTLFRVFMHALPPRVCRQLTDASIDLKGCSSLQEEIHALTDAHPSAITFLRRVGGCLAAAA